METAPISEPQPIASSRSRVTFLVNRALIVLAVAAILGGLLFDQWHMVLRNAILL